MLPRVLTNCPKPALLFLDCSFLSLQLFPSRIRWLFEPETQGKGTQTGVCAQEPMGSCLVSFSLSWLPLREELPLLFSRICSVFSFIFQCIRRYPDRILILMCLLHYFSPACGFIVDKKTSFSQINEHILLCLLFSMGFCFLKRKGHRLLKTQKALFSQDWGSLPWASKECFEPQRPNWLSWSLLRKTKTL